MSTDDASKTRDPADLMPAAIDAAAAPPDATEKAMLASAKRACTIMGIGEDAIVNKTRGGRS